MFKFGRRCVFALALFGLAASSVFSAVDYDNQKLTLALITDPPSLDSAKATDSISGMVLGHVMEGLLRYDRENRLVPGIALRWQFDEQGAVFYLREDARWSDGQPVTADDFVFAWRRALDPATASQYAFILYPLKNAEAINQGRMPPEKLAVEAVDSRTLRLELRSPTPHFLKLLTFWTYLPQREDFYTQHANDYASGHDKLLYTGPFQITRWVRDARLVLERNPHYWDQQAIRLQQIDWAYFTADSSTVLNLFRDSQIAETGLNAELLQVALREGWRMQRSTTGAIFYLGFNHRAFAPTANADLRRALHLVFDPYELINLVIGIPGQLPGLSFFPVWLQGQTQAFRIEHPAPAHRPDLAKAREHLARAARTMGGEIPPLVLLSGDTPSARREAEYFQGLFSNRLGLNIRIDAQVFKQRLSKMLSGQYDIVMAGWGPDYDDPLTFGDLFTSWNQNNRGEYRNPELDQWVRLAESSFDPAERMRAFAEVQRIIYEDTVVIPTYESSQILVTHPRLKGVIRRPIGTSPDYTRAWIEPAP